MLRKHGQVKSITIPHNGKLLDNEFPNFSDCFPNDAGNTSEFQATHQRS